MITIISRRIGMIFEAFSDLANPSWITAKYFRDGGTVDDVISLALRTHVLKKAKG